MRKKLRKAARMGNRKGITSSTKDPFDRLPMHKRVYIKARVEGKTAKQAAVAADISKPTASRYESEAEVQQAYRHLMRKAIPAQKLVNLIKGGCEAKMPVYGPDGKKVTERADWKTRQAYIKMAAEHANFHEAKAQGNQTAISVVVRHVGQPDLGASVHAGRSQHIIEASTEADGAAQPL